MIFTKIKYAQISSETNTPQEVEEVIMTNGLSGVAVADAMSKLVYYQTGIPCTYEMNSSGRLGDNVISFAFTINCGGEFINIAGYGIRQ